MKLLRLLLLLMPLPLWAQTTTVTGTIVDPQGNPYSNGTASARKVVATGQSEGVPVNGTTNSGGTFSITLPSPASYIFTICAPPTQIGPTGNPTPKLVCFSNVNPIAISGASQDVSGNLNSVAVNLGPNITGVSGVVGNCGSAGFFAIYAVSGNTTSCTNSLPYNFLTSFPAACPANQVNVQVGLTLGCASLTTSYLPLTGTWAFTGTMSGNFTISGALTSSNLAAGNVANKNVPADAIRYVSGSGNDANDGLSWGTAKATLSAGLSALPNCTVTPTPVSATGGAGSSVTVPCGFVYLTEGLFTIPSAIVINSSFVGIKGMGQFNTILSCSTGSGNCITVNGASSWGGTVTAYPGGIFDVDIEGGGAAGTGLLYLNATGLHLHRTRIAGFTATGGQGLMVQDDNSATPPNAGCAYSERMDWQDVALDNNKTLLRLDTVTGACTSMGHQNWSGLKLQLNNGQTAIKLTGATSFYSSFVSGVINTYPPNTNTYTSLDLSGLTGAGAFSQMSFLMIHDNGGGGTLTACNGCTQANFHNIVGWSPSSNLDNQVQDGGWLLNGSATGLNGAAIAFALNNSTKMTAYLDSANGVSFWDGAANALSIDPTAVVVTKPFILNSVTFASLGTPANGTIIYCSDCTIANPCAGAGTGALAKRLNGVWVCN